MWLDLNAETLIRLMKSSQEGTVIQFSYLGKDAVKCYFLQLNALGGGWNGFVVVVTSNEP